MAYTAAQINSIFQAVLQRPADTAAIQTYANSSQSDAQVRTQIETSYEASVNVNPIIRLYEGAFGRVPDTSGLAANYTTYINGYNITQLAQNFLNSSEGVAKFGSNPTVTAGFVATIYTQALNRTAGSSEISYWTSTGKSAAQVLAEISNSQEAVNKEAAPIVTYLDSAAQGAPNSGTLYSQTGSSTGSTGQTFVLTTSIGDNLIGTSGNDTFVGDNTTTQASDSISGGAGTDTFNYFTPTTTGNTITLPQLSGVEVVNIVNRGTTAIGLTGSGNQFAGFSSLSDVQLVTIRNSVSAADFIGLRTGTVGGLDNVTGGSATETFVYSNTATSGSLAVANGTNVAAAINGTGLTNINVLSTGSAGATSGNTLTSLASNGTITSLSITGDRALTATASTGLTTLQTVDASAFTANLSLDLTADTSSLTSVRGGSGNDTFKFAAGALVNVTTLDGGTGTNTLSVGDASITSALTSAELKAINAATNFQVLDFNNATSGSADVLDVSAISKFSAFSFSGSLAPTAGTTGQGTNAITVTNEVNGNSFTLLANETGAAVTSGVGGAALSVSAAIDNNANSINLGFGTSSSTTGLTIAGGAATSGTAGVGINLSNFETVNLSANGTNAATHSIDGGANTATTYGSALVLSNNATLNISGSANLTIGNAANTGDNLVGVNVNVNAASATGNIGISFDATDNNVTYAGSAGTNTITFKGGGIETINISASTAKADTITFTSAANQDAASKISAITGFNLGASGVGDTVGLAGTTATSVATNGNNVNGSADGSVKVTFASGIATVSGSSSLTLAQTVNAVDYALGQQAAGKTAAFVYGSDSYVLKTLDTGTTGFAAGTDHIVKLVGLTGETAVSTSAYGASTIHVA